MVQHGTSALTPQDQRLRCHHRSPERGRHPPPACATPLARSGAILSFARYFKDRYANPAKMRGKHARTTMHRSVNGASTATAGEPFSFDVVNVPQSGSWQKPRSINVMDFSDSQDNRFLSNRCRIWVSRVTVLFRLCLPDASDRLGGTFAATGWAQPYSCRETCPTPPKRTLTTGSGRESPHHPHPIR